MGNLYNVCLMYLPPNTISVIQPIEQGVSKCLNARYRRHLVRLMIQHLDHRHDLWKISIFYALQ